MRNHKSRWRARRTWREYENDGVKWRYPEYATVKSTRQYATRGFLWRVARDLPDRNFRKLAAL